MLNNQLQKHLKLLQIKQFKTAEATGDLIGIKIANRTAKVSNNSQQNHLKTVINEHDEDEEITKERYISPEKRQKLIDNLRLI